MTDIIKTNFHTHTLLCDGTDTPEELVEAAIAKGFDALGFSGHCYTAYDESYCMSPEGTAKYKSEIERLRKKFEGKLSILCGIEQDFGSDEPINNSVGSTKGGGGADAKTAALRAAAGLPPEDEK